MSASPPPHLVIAFARCNGEAWLQAMAAQPAGSLANLGRLLRGMKLAATDTGRADSLSTPHERVLARALGLAGATVTDGLIPWAAHDASQAGLDAAGKAWGLVTPCHWSMGREHATLTDPAALQLSMDDSRQLMAAMQPYFETEGITLHCLAPERWLAEGELLRTLPTASLDRVLGRNVDAWLPGARTAPSLRRLQNEMQMLLYTHPLNDERNAQQRLPVNSFWLSGTGALDPALHGQPHETTLLRSLAPAAFSNDWSAYSQAWTLADAGEIAQWLARQQAGTKVRLSLCSEASAMTFDTARPGLLTKISSVFSAQRPLDVLHQL